MQLNLRRFIKKLDNPLDNDELLKAAIKGYAEENSRYISFKNTDNCEGLVDREAKEEFELFVFYKWKEFMLEKIKNHNDEVIRNIKTDDFLMKTLLIKYLNAYNPKTRDEIFDYLEKNDGITEKKYLDYLYENLYTSYEPFDIWGKYSSYAIHQNEEKRIDPKHKLMINVDISYVHKFALLFVKKCEELNLPYRINMMSIIDLANQFEIDSDSEHLYKYIEVLEQLKEEHKEEFEKHIHQPSILTAHIDNWIGYISNTKNINSKSSFNGTEARVTAFRTVLYKFNKVWTKNHINKDIQINHKTISYREFLSDLIYNELIKQLKIEIKNTESEEDQIVTEEDLKSPIVNNAIKQMINNNMDVILKNINDLSKLDKKELSGVETRKEGLYITTDAGLVRKALAKQPYILSQQSTNFIDQFRDKIKIECKKFGILPENISLDNIVFDELLEKDEKDKKELHERLVKHRKFVKK